jgi:hypothetical protein
MPFPNYWSLADIPVLTGSSMSGWLFSANRESLPAISGFFTTDPELGSKSLAYTKDLSEIGPTFSGLDETVGNVRTGDIEPEKWQMRFTYAIPPGKRLVCELGWTNNCPVQPTLRNRPFHCGRIDNHSRKEQPAD